MTAATVVESPETRIQLKVVSVLERVIRGKASAQCWQVTFYKYHRGFTALMSALGGMGLVQGDPAQELWSQANAFFVAGALGLVLAALLELYKAYNIEQTAIHALAARDAFALVHENLDLSLQESDPLPQLNVVVDESKTLLRNFHKVMPAGGPTVTSEAERLGKDLLDKNCRYWQLPPAGLGR